MKGGGVGVYQGGGGKRRWKCLAMGVLFLVVLSMLVPLVFLLGLYNGFASTTTGYPSDQSSTGGSTPTDQTRLVEKLIDKLGQPLPKEVRNIPNEVDNEIIGADLTPDVQQQNGTQIQIHRKVPPVPNKINVRTPGKTTGKTTGKTKAAEKMKSSVEGDDKLCELRFGSYCLWRKENGEDMNDSMVKKLKDVLFVARAYFPSVAKLRAQSKLSHELRQNIQELEHVLSESTTDTDLPSQIEKKLLKMEATITRARQVTSDCNNVDKKLRQILDLNEDEANFHMKQSAFLYQLAVQTMPKSHHCLSMRLTLEYFKSSLHDTELSFSEKYSDPNLQHYILFSNNVLATSVVINSTVSHARESRNVVFHVLTDEQNYFAMKVWFFKNKYREAAVQVLDLQHLDLDYPDKGALLSSSMPLEFRVIFHGVDNEPAHHSTTEYISVFSHAHYLLPYIFPNLKRVVVLDDDIVVQQDLFDLWKLNMGAKVNGALQLCSVRLGHLNNYPSGNIFNRSACAWMSGLNVIDLVRWKEVDVTETYRKLAEKVLTEGLIGPITLSASLQTFQNLTYALDGAWILSGLGHDYGLDVQDIRNAAVLHYNGKMKPWLELGIPKYKRYWKRFLNREDQFLAECNVNP